MNDEQIYKRLLNKEEQALEDILDKYGGLIKYIINGTVKLNVQELDECISDVLFLLWKRADQYDYTKASLKSWIVLITRGSAIDYYRKIEKHKNTTFIDDYESTIVFHEEFDKLGYEEIIDLLQMLTPPDNEIFYDRFILGKSIDAISIRHDISKDAIYKRINRGRIKLKDIFIKEGYNV